MRERMRVIERGQSITFRVPSDTPDYLLRQLQRLRETEKRNFSSRIAQFVLKGVNETYAKSQETVTIPLPKTLTKEQRNWLKHEHSEALLGTIVYQLLQDPIRATTLLASLNSSAPTVDEALYLQEKQAEIDHFEEEQTPVSESSVPEETKSQSVAENLQEEAHPTVDMDDIDLSSLLEDLHQEEETVEEEEVEDANPLGDFFERMNQ